MQCYFIDFILDEPTTANSYPLSRILHIISLVVSAILVLVGIHILMKADVSEKLDNYVSNLEAGLIAPTEMISRAG